MDIEMIATLAATASVRSSPGNVASRRHQPLQDQQLLTKIPAKEPFIVLESNVYLDVANYPAMRAFSIST
jgi:hypothetical protein